MKGKIKIAIVGVGNCASSPVQGLETYRHRDPTEAAGLIHPELGGCGIDDVEVVAAFDVDHRKVGQPLRKQMRDSDAFAALDQFIDGKMG